MNNIRPVVIIPTYNNEGTIAKVIDEVREYCENIVVVNDGSTDNTAEILHRIQNIELIEFDINKGKGAALQAAFRLCDSKGFSHAITFDADGQHLAIDIPVLLQKINDEPLTLWIGDRVITVKDGVAQPPRSRFGRQFGAFWFKFYTGNSIRDTQCGLRVYPLSSIIGLECYHPRYEYEIEILITASWNEIPVKSVPVHLLYLTKEERVSHFRPVRDFMRISKVNSRAAMVRLFLPKNVRKVRGLSIRAKIKTFIINEMKSNTTPRRAAGSLGLGVLVGVTPFHGFQMLLIIALSFITRLNRPLAFLGVSVSSAPLLPFWIAAGYYVGAVSFPSRLLSPYIAVVDKWIPQSWIKYLNLPVNDFATGFVQWFFGSLILSVICGIATYFIALPICRKLLKSQTVAG